jgi:hypothetical protein
VCSRCMIARQRNANIRQLLYLLQSKVQSPNLASCRDTWNESGLLSGHVHGACNIVDPPCATAAVANRYIYTRTKNPFYTRLYIVFCYNAYGCILHGECTHPLSCNCDSSSCNRISLSCKWFVSSCNQISMSCNWFKFSCNQFRPVATGLFSQL